MKSTHICPFKQAGLFAGMGSIAQAAEGFNLADARELSDALSDGKYCRRDCALAVKATPSDEFWYCAFTAYAAQESYPAKVEEVSE